MNTLPEVPGCQTTRNQFITQEQPRKTEEQKLYESLDDAKFSEVSMANIQNAQTMSDVESEKMVNPVNRVS